MLYEQTIKIESLSPKSFLQLSGTKAFPLVSLLVQVQDDVFLAQHLVALRTIWKTCMQAVVTEITCGSADDYCAYNDASCTLQLIPCSMYTYWRRWRRYNRKLSNCRGSWTICLVGDVRARSDSGRRQWNASSFVPRFRQCIMICKTSVIAVHDHTHSASPVVFL